MQSNKANAVWASQTSSQTVGVNNWTQYQLSLTGSSYKFQINSAATTSTNLQYYTNREGVDITAGDSILLSTNGTSFSSGTAGAVTYVGPSATQLTAPSSPGSAPALTHYGRVSYISPDGFNLYMVRSATGGTADWIIYQYALSTAFDIQTASYTGKTSFQFTAGTYGSGFTFKPDGTILYITKDTYIYAYALGTAWDISTANSTVIGQIQLTAPSTTSPWTGGAPFFTHIAFSPDGTKVILQNVRTDNNQGPSPSSYGNFAIYTLSVPWVINTCTTTTTNFTNTSSIYYYGSASYLGFWVSPDGKTITIWEAESGSTGNAFVTFTMATPYVLVSSPTLSIRTTSLGPGTITQEGAAYYSANGTIFYINWKSGARASSTGNDLYGKYNVNISSFSLGAAPTFAYNAAPTVRVDAETTAARVNLFPYQVYQASSTTSQAVIYKPTSGYVAANDTILLNGTTSVTVTSVTEGTNLGVAAIPITTAANRTYASKVFALPTSARFDFNIRISPDGGTLIAGLRGGTYGAGLYQYSLSTPWDINTATFANKFVSVTGDGNSLTSTNGGTVAFDVSPDGSRLVMIGAFVTDSSTSQTDLTGREYLMSQKWDIGTLRPSGVTWTTSGQGSTNNTTTTCVRFVPNGTQIVWVTNTIPGSGTNTQIRYLSLGTPYQLSTASPTAVQWTTTSTSQGDVRSVTFTPDGLNIITQGVVTTSNTLGTASNMATATTTNNPNTATTRWAWPAGTMSSSTAAAYGGEFSPDGTKYYVMNGDSTSIGSNNIWQFNVMVIPQTSYTCNFATQGSAPTSVVIPDRSVAQTITTTLSGGNMTFAASAVATNARGIATKITAPGNFTTVTNATLSMWRS